MDLHDILATAVWLKMWQMYFNSGTTKEACEAFDVRAKQLLRVLKGWKYLGGASRKADKTSGLATRGKRQKSTTDHTAMKEPGAREVKKHGKERKKFQHVHHFHHSSVRASFHFCARSP